LYARTYSAYASIGWPVGALLVLDQDERREFDDRPRVVRPERGVWQVAAQGLVLLAGDAAPTSTDPNLHRPRRARAVRDPRASRAGLRRAGGIGVAAVVAFLLADPGKDLPWDLVLRPDLLVDRQKPERDVANGES
jgi:hypothetical protein